MTLPEIMKSIRSQSESFKLDPDLVLAISSEESGYVPGRAKYEPDWGYLVKPDKYAKQLGISEKTEIQLQKFSWGILQIMGSVARECGYEGHLPLLCQPELGILYGCKKIQSLCKIYKDEKDIISAYNQGTPVRVDGVYKNNDYVQNVLKRLSRLRLI